MTNESASFEGWAILELMGHRKLGGYLREETIAGGAFIRIDVPNDEGEGNKATQFYAPASVYCITPTTEDMARAIARRTFDPPVHRWELPQLSSARVEPMEPLDLDEDAFREAGA